jgi:hypothetical protein
MKCSRRKKPLPGKRGAKVDSVPFHREISAMQIPYDQMSSALDWKDLGRTRSAACHVVLAWLDMEAAFVRFVERTPAGLGLGSCAWRERLILTAINYLVRELFQRALEETRSWTVSQDELRALHVVLRWLHERLQLWSVVELPVLRP